MHLAFMYVAENEARYGAQINQNASYADPHMAATSGRC